MDKKNGSCFGNSMLKKIDKNHLSKAKQHDADQNLQTNFIREHFKLARCGNLSPVSYILILQNSQFSNRN